MLSFFFDDLLLPVLPDDFKTSPLVTTEAHELYECEVCGGLVEVLRRTRWPLSCCGKVMGRVTERKEEQRLELYTPAHWGEWPHTPCGRHALRARRRK